MLKSKLIRYHVKLIFLFHNLLTFHYLSNSLNNNTKIYSKSKF